MGTPGDTDTSTRPAGGNMSLAALVPSYSHHCLHPSCTGCSQAFTPPVDLHLLICVCIYIGGVLLSGASAALSPLTRLAPGLDTEHLTPALHVTVTTASQDQVLCQPLCQALDPTWCQTQCQAPDLNPGVKLSVRKCDLT